MAKIGEIDNLIENLVGRGLIAPKFVGRQVGQSAIESLSGLQGELQASAAKQQADQIASLKDITRQQSQNKTRLQQGGVASPTSNPGIASDLTKPFLVSKTNPGSSAFNPFTTIATPGSKGFNLTSHFANDPLVALAQKNTLASNLPELDTQFMGADFKTLQDVRNKLFGSTKNPQVVDQAFGA